MEIVKAFSTNNMHTDIAIRGTYEEPLFRAIDIGEVLEIKSIRSHIMHFNETEKKIINSESNGGMQNVAFLTEKGLYKILFKSNKPVAVIFQDWVCEVIKELRLKGVYNMNQKLLEEKEKIEQEKKEIEDENKKLQQELEKQNKNINTEKKSVIYIYNLDTRMETPELKIGYSTNIHNRIKTYKQTHKFGKKEFEIEIQNMDVRTTEHFVHLLLLKYKIADEVFRLSVSKARYIIMKLVNLLTVVNLTDELEKENMLHKMIEYEYKLMNNEECEKISTCTVETQTDIGEEQSIENVISQVLTNVNRIKTELEEGFDNFIREHCIVRPDVEVSSTDIMGQYRIVNKKASKENYSGFTSYLSTLFKPSRLRLQNKDQVINGYMGIKLKDIEYKKKLDASDEQTFLFNACVFSPSGKVLLSKLTEEYKRWKRSLDKDHENPLLETELRNYLKNCDYVLYTTLWADGGNGQGYYGLSLKCDIEKTRMTSSTGKRVEKRDAKTNGILQTWETIAKAATAENMCAANMSRIIRDKKIFNDDYYYCCCVKA